MWAKIQGLWLFDKMVGIFLKIAYNFSLLNHLTLNICNLDFFSVTICNFTKDALSKRIAFMFLLCYLGCITIMFELG